MPVSSEKNQEYYWRDLEGCKVFDPAAHYLGTVSHLYEAGDCDVMVVTLDTEGQTKEQHIPFWLDEVIVSIDLVERTIIASWDPACGLG
jgi:16S rRNA processing protein RimM